MHAPTTTDWVHLKRTLRYLKGMLTHDITLNCHPNRILSVYTNADSVGDATERRSTSSYVTYLGPNIISWSSKKHGILFVDGGRVPCFHHNLFRSTLAHVGSP
ncbi:Uncharacterized mitochondrial protein AtMg00810 [Linum perenne]